MVVLSSPSGAGKTTLVKLLSKNKNFHISVSHTTREPRPSEIPDKDYYFVNHDKFKNLIKNEEFLEYAKVFDHLYGTTRTPVIDKLEKGKNEQPKIVNVSKPKKATEYCTNDLIQSTKNGLIKLAIYFENPENPYIASAKIGDKFNKKGQDYLHLIRSEEWNI